MIKKCVSSYHDMMIKVVIKTYVIELLVQVIKIFKINSMLNRSIFCLDLN